MSQTYDDKYYTQSTQALGLPCFSAFVFFRAQCVNIWPDLTQLRFSLKKEENLCAYTHIHTNSIKVPTCICNTPIICYLLSVHLLIVAVNYDYINVSCL